jgi:hypothetical protein
VHIVAEELQRLFGRDQRLVWVPQSFDEFLLREAIFLAHQYSEYTLTEFWVWVVDDLSQSREIVAAARLERDDTEARCLQRLQGRQAHLYWFVLVAQDVQHRLKILVALAHS